MNANRSTRRRRVVLLSVLLLVLFVASGAIFGFLARGADTIFRKERFTNICTRCGIQTSEEFLYFLDAETIDSEYLLPVSRESLFPGCDANTCRHSYALVGRTEFRVDFSGRIQRIARGFPEGDRFFADPNVKELFARRANTDPERATAVMEQFAKKRYAGQTPILPAHPTAIGEAASEGSWDKPIVY